MTIEHLANIAEIVGMLIVVVTLVYLAIQTKQNNDLLKAQARFNLVERRANVSAGALNQYVQDSVHKYASGEPVTEGERGVAVMSALRVIELWEWQFIEYQAGMLEFEQLPVRAWKTWYHGDGIFPSPLKEVWEIRKATYNPEFVNFMNENVIADGGGGSGTD